MTLLDSKNNLLLVQIQVDSCNTANDPLSNFSWKKCKWPMPGRYHNGVSCWASGSKVLWCLCRLLCPECLSWWNTSGMVWLCPIFHPGSTNGGFLPLNVDYFLQWMIVLHGMDLLSLEAQTAAELEGWEPEWASTGSTLSLPPCSQEWPFQKWR